MVSLIKRKHLSFRAFIALLFSAVHILITLSAKHHHVRAFTAYYSFGGYSTWYHNRITTSTSTSNRRGRSKDVTLVSYAFFSDLMRDSSSDRSSSSSIGGGGNKLVASTTSRNDDTIRRVNHFDNKRNKPTVTASKENDSCRSIRRTLNPTAVNARKVGNTTDSQKQRYEKRQDKKSVHGMPVLWKANFIVSSRTQRRIQDAAASKVPSSSSHEMKAPIFDTAIRVLDALLTTPVEECNEVNAMCALTLCTKTILQQITSTGANSKLNNNINIVSSSEKVLLTKQREQIIISSIQLQKLKTRLNSLLDIVMQLIENKQLNFRHLANAVWSASKLLHLLQNVIPLLYLSQDDEEECSTTSQRADAINDNCDDDPTLTLLEKLLKFSVKPITEYLVSSSSSAAITATGEISMILWAYSQWKPKVNPTGWLWPPTDARLPLQQKRKIQQRGGTHFQVGKDDTIIFERRSTFGEDKNRLSQKQLSSATTTNTTSVQVLMNSAAKALLRVMNDQGFSPIVTTTNLPNNNSTKVRRVVGKSTWNELSNIAHSYTYSQYGDSAESEALMKEICEEAIYRLTTTNHQGAYSPPLPWDVSLIVWSLGVMQVGKYRLVTNLRRLLDAIITKEFIESKSCLEEWNTKDVVQLSIALAHAAIDDRTLLSKIFEKSTVNVAAFQSWELSVLLWVQARLYLTSKLEDDVYSRFATAAVSCLRSRMMKGELFFANGGGLGSQEQANLAWSLTVLEEYTADSADLLRAVFAEASDAHSYITQEHAHQLWQSYFLLRSECPKAVDFVSADFAVWLEDRWKEEKSRKKNSSASHKSLSDTLKLMRVAHINEHDEDVDVAIVLKETSVWTSQASLKCVENGKHLHHRIGIEIDGPSHFVNSGKRALGHTVLKYRLLKQQGWIVVRVPYYEFDKIPFWASMERQRYLQRLLKTHPNLRFSGADISQYKASFPNRKSRYD